MSTIEETKAIDPREAWLAERATMIGASESPAILGVGYADESAWTIYARKVAPPDQQEAKDEWEGLEWGQLMQPVVAEMFRRKTGFAVREIGAFEVARHRELPWIGATLDAVATTPDGEGVLEIKNVGHYNAADWQREEPPLRVIVQIQHQLLVSGLDFGFAAACLGGNKLAYLRIDRDDRFIDVLLERLGAFWHCVETLTPPPVDWSESCTHALRRLHPKDNGETAVLPDIARDWDEAILAAQDRIKADEQIIGECKNRIREAIGGATFGQIVGGATYSYKHQSRRGYAVAPSESRPLVRLKTKEK